MKLSGLKINAKVAEEGAWVDNIPELGTLRLKVRGAGNKDWRRLSTKLIAAVPRKHRVDGLDPDEQDRINAILIRDTGLLDWDNLEGDDGNPIPYSKDMAQKLLTDPDTVKFREGAMWACATVAERQADDVEATAKN